MRNLAIGIIIIWIALWLPMMLLPADVKQQAAKLLANSNAVWLSSSLAKQASGHVMIRVMGGKNCGDYSLACAALPNREVRIFDAKKESVRSERTDRQGMVKDNLEQGAYWLEVAMGPGEETKDVPGYIYVTAKATSTLNIRIKQSL